MKMEQEAGFMQVQYKNSALWEEVVFGRMVGQEGEEQTEDTEGAG